MEIRKQELQELAKEERFRPAKEVSTFKIIKSIKELVSVAIPLIESMKDEWLLAEPALATVIASLFGINDAAREFIDHGGTVKIIVDVSYPVIDNVRELLSIGEEVRHIDQHGVLFVMYDRKTSLTAISAPTRASLSCP